MAGVITYLVEIAFAASMIGFITIIMLIPTKNVIANGKAGSKMNSILVPVLIIGGAFIAIVMIPLSLISGKIEVLAPGLAGSFILLGAYVAIWFEYRSMKDLLERSLPMEEAVHAHHHGPEHHAHGPENNLGQMTVECPRCHKHLVIAKGASVITCPHCGLSGSL